MKNRNLLLTAAVFFVMISGLKAQNVPSYVPTNGLVGWWPFNGNANDESGNGNNGTVNGATLAPDRFGNTGKSYSFDGNSLISVLSNPSLNIQTNAGITVSIWAYKTDPIAIGHLIGKRSGCFNNIFQYQMGFAIGAGGIGWGGMNGGSDSYMDNNSIPDFPMNSWLHFTGTFNGIIWKFYQNGILKDSLTAPIQPEVADNLLIGGSGDCQKFIGNLDDVAIWSRALTQQEITALYLGENTTDNCIDLPFNLQQGLVAYWPFCGNANNVAGSFGNGNSVNATLAAGRFNQENKAFSFSGTNSRIDVDSFNHEVFNQDFTISIFSLFRNFNPYYPYLFVSGKYGVSEGLVIHGLGPPYGVNQNKVGVIFYDTLSTGPTIFTQKVVPNTWNLFNIIRRSDSIYVYLNSKLQDKAFLGTRKLKKTNGLIFGRGPGSSGVGDALQQNLDGKIDDIAIWNRALSQQEITQLYNQGICQTSITVTDTLLIHTGITSYNPVSYSNTLKVWPNPGNQDITIDAGNLAMMQGWKIRVSNSQGVQIYPSGSQAGLINQQQQVLDMSNWGGNGLYFLYLIDPQNNIQEVKKIVLAP